MLALLSCQVSAPSPTPENYWAYFPDPPTFQAVTWSSDPVQVHTDQPRLLGGSYTSYDRDHYPINFNYTFKGLTDDLPVCFNFPINHTGDFITPTKEGCIQIRSDQISRSVLSSSLRPHESQHSRPPCPSPTPGVHSDSRPSSQ